MSAKWQGLDMHEVYGDWAHSLQDLSLGAINHGIELSEHEEHPPNLGKFRKLCQGYKPPVDESNMITKQFNPISQNDGLKRFENIRDMLAKKMNVTKQ
tara:strand:+ start:922 stop:1215 length:294 start_codon:yes stop_codon:yes gene_type:complete